MMQRYSIIKERNPREIVLLRGRGCVWKKCTFCDYHIDCSDDADENYVINSAALNQVTGIYNKLEVINSGSFPELDRRTMDLILQKCSEKHISALYFECHYLLKSEVPKAKKRFAEQGVTLKIKTGVETFDTNYRENMMRKGFGSASPAEIAGYADEVCLLFGLTGQTEKSMRNDIRTGLQYFDRICINVMNENATSVKPDGDVIRIFLTKIAPEYSDNPRVDILTDNTDFGVGSPDEKETEVF